MADPSNHLPVQVVHPSLLRPFFAPMMANLPAGVLLSTMPCRSPQEAAALLSAVEGATGRVNDLPSGTMVKLVDVVLYEQLEEDQDTGEPVLRMRTIIRLADGRALQTPSEHFRHSLTRQMERWGSPPLNRLPPYDPPIDLMVRHEPGRTPNTSWLHGVFQLPIKATVDPPPKGGAK